MAGTNRSRQIGTLVYERHRFKPEDLLRFIEMKPFTEGWKQLGLGDQDLFALQVMIMLGPKGPPVVAGTRGLRKIRFAPKSWGKGKSGAARVCYAYLEEHGVVLLVIAYAKNEKDDLTPAEKKAIRRLLQAADEEFAEGIVT